MSNLPIFSHPSFGTVRIVERNDEPWFVAKDVLKALGYAEDYNPSRALQAVPEEWKGVQPIHTPGGMQEMLIISEQGLYFFLGRSDKPVALPFQKWLAGDVIPSIRKHGLYATEEVVDRILDDPDFGITLLQRYKFEREQRQLAESQRECLTRMPIFGILNVPNYHRRIRRLCRAPHGEKCGFSCFCHQSTSLGVGYILAKRRPGVREAPAAVVSRGASFCLFLCPTL